MLEELTIDDIKFKIDPETCFWGLGDSDELERFYDGIKEELVHEMHALRFDTDIILLYLNATDRCNANCPYCYLPKEIKSRGTSVTYEEMEEIVRKFVEFFDKRGMKGSIVFHGAEPFMIKEEMFRIIDDYNTEVNFGIQTNGTMLTEDDVIFIKEKGINIGISFDSPDEKTDDLLRGKGHYKKVLNDLDWFDGYERLNVVTTITKYNQRYLVEMVRFLSERKLGLCLMNPVRGTQKAAISLRPDPLELADEFIRAVDEAIDLTKNGRRFVIGDFANLLLGIVAPSTRILMCDISPCGGGRRFLAISADGNAYPCGEFIGKEEFLGGNIFSDSIEDICDSVGFNKVRTRSVEEINECDICPFRNICGAPCPSEIDSTNGTMYKKSYYCDFYKKVIEHAFNVIHRDDVRYVLKERALKGVFSIRE